MLKSILFPVVEKPITLKQTIKGVVQINTLFLIYYLIITLIALILKTPTVNTTDMYNNPIIAWIKIPSLIFCFWDVWVSYKYLKARLQTNGCKFPLTTIYLFFGSLYFIFHPDGIIDFIIGILLCYHTGRKFIKTN